MGRSGVACGAIAGAWEGQRGTLVANPATERMLRFFSYAHLPPDLQGVSKPCCDLAQMMAEIFPDGSAEVTTGLRKLLEAKDCFVRAKLESH
jgi:hypothetical protein